MEASPSVSGDSAVMFIRPVKLIRLSWSGPVERYARFSGPNGSASVGMRSCASAVAAARPPMNSASVSEMSVSSTVRSVTSTVRSGPFAVSIPTPSSRP